MHDDDSILTCGRDVWAVIAFIFIVIVFLFVPILLSYKSVIKQPININETNSQIVLNGSIDLIMPLSRFSKNWSRELSTMSAGEDGYVDSKWLAIAPNRKTYIWLHAPVFKSYDLEHPIYVTKSEEHCAICLYALPADVFFDECVDIFHSSLLNEGLAYEVKYIYNADSGIAKDKYTHGMRMYVQDEEIEIDHQTIECQ